MEVKKPENLKNKDATLNLFCFQINKVMFRFKVHFFLFIGAMGTILIYIPVVARNRLGMSASALAAVLTTQQLITIISKPIIGYIADYFNKLKIIINSLIVIQTVCFFLILLIPPIRQLPEEDGASNYIDIFTDVNTRSEYIMVAVKPQKYCDHTSATTLSSFIQSTEMEDIDNIICIIRSNQTDPFCLKQGKYDNQRTYDSIENYCCSIISYNISLKNLTLPEKRRRNYLNLLTAESDIDLQNSNQSFICNLEEEVYFQTSDESVNDFETLQYWMFATLLVVTAICINSIFTLADTACMESVHKHGGDFGRQRLYGAVGWGALAPIGGLLCDLTNDYLAAWILMAVLLLLALWNISRLDLEKPHYSENILKDVSTVLKSGEFMTFELGVFMNGMGAGIMWFYLVWFLTALGGSKFLCGLVQYVQCFAGEIPFMFFSTWIIKRVGHMNLITISLVCYALRFIWYSYLQNPWLVLPMEIVHGFTYGTFYPAVAAFGKISARPGTEATTQSILFTTHEGLGAGVGCVLAGIGFDYFGGHRTFLYVGIFFICGTILNILNTLLTRKRIKVLNLTPTPTIQKW